MSDMMERRERRRPWIILGVLVSVPLLLLGVVLTAVELHRQGYLPRIFEAAKRMHPETSQPVRAERLDPVSIMSLQTGDIIYSQLDKNGFVTSISHFFRELPPDAVKGFTVERKDSDHGTIVLYRLRNIGTGESFDFRDVPVEKAGEAGWAISEDGQVQIRDQLQAIMRVQVRRIGH
jgi:hypothetical protein